MYVHVIVEKDLCKFVILSVYDPVSHIVYDGQWENLMSRILATNEYETDFGQYVVLFTLHGNVSFPFYLNF